jgi:ABC-type antimicrobial peptide transport system permease subunit
VVAASLVSERFHAVLLGTFAMLALVLTALGIAGVVSYDVRRRRREIGIRMALGEGAGQVVRGVTAQGMRPVLLGLAAGIVGSLFLTRALSSLLWGVTSTDPRTMAVVAVTLSLVALLASWIPARGATRANPVDALRAD